MDYQSDSAFSKLTSVLKTKEKLKLEEGINYKASFDGRLSWRQGQLPAILFNTLDSIPLPKYVINMIIPNFPICRQSSLHKGGIITTNTLRGNYFNYQETMQLQVYLFQFIQLSWYMRA